ncbi:hypothetical protein [Solirubrum puertoriconensis]|nr:hypothetical protein [Solirubrum puertoriconensis]
MRVSLPLFLGLAGAAMLGSGCVRNIQVPQATPQYGLQLRIRLPKITPATTLDTVRVAMELTNTNDEPYVVSSPARPQATLPVAYIDGAPRAWQMHMRRGKDVRITIPARGTYRATYDLPMSAFAGERREAGKQYQLQLLYHPKVYGPKGHRSTFVEIQSNKLAF